jgi:hypothetical protein
MSVNGLWLAIIAMGSRSPAHTLPLLGDYGARRQLDWLCRRLDGSRDLILELAAESAFSPICVRVVEHRLSAHDLVRLKLLRKALDEIAP